MTDAPSKGASRPQNVFRQNRYNFRIILPFVTIIWNYKTFCCCHNRIFLIIMKSSPNLIENFMLNPKKQYLIPNRFRYWRNQILFISHCFRDIRYDMTRGFYNLLKLLYEISGFWAFSLFKVVQSALNGKFWLKLTLNRLRYIYWEGLVL